MKWTKLELGEYPKGDILVRIEVEKNKMWYEVGIISKNIYNNEWYFYIDQGFPAVSNVDCLYDCNAHYIKLDKIKMPKEENAK